MRPIRERLRPLGGVTGIAIAIAGGFGAAVGGYSLPDPQSLRAEEEIYARVDQRAVAVWKTTVGNEYRELRIEATRGGSAEARGRVTANGESESSTGRDVRGSFQAHLLTCTDPGTPNEQCDFQEWKAAVLLEQIEFDPAMQSARFNGIVDGCSFDVRWTGEGLPAPFEQRNAEASLGSQGFNEKAEGFAEVSRVAPARIDTSCVGSTTESAPGFLSVGLRRYIVGRGGVDWSQPQ